MRIPARGEWLGLVLMSFSASLIAACIHSLYVFDRGSRLYNAELGGFFFNDGMSGYTVPNLRGLLLWSSRGAVAAVLTFLVLLFFRKRAAYRWLAWISFVVFWTWVCFNTEIAYH